jgi:D-alanyl-D-alanine carboxypeptidase/D-alanyl-D-alanine-endopeptidase (penicillin-binding protein 4)
MMGTMTSRRRLLGLLAAGAASPAMAGAPMASLRPLPRGAEDAGLTRPPRRPEQIRPPSGAAIVDAFGLPGDVSFVIADARSGEMLEVLRPLLRQPPASTAKALTALYALDRLGPDHRFVTRLVATGPLRDGRVEGDLVLVGGGDPALDTDGLGRLAARLKDAGVHEVTGRFGLLTDALPLVAEIDPEQPPHVAYNPAVGALNLNFNRVYFEWIRRAQGYEVKMDARSAAFSPRVSTARMQVVDRALPVYTYNRGDGVDEWTVARRALGGGGARWLPVRRPDLYAAEVFQTLARSHGIVLDAPEPVGALPDATADLARHESAPLSVILKGMLRHSTNLTAEAVGLAASARRGAAPETLAASAGQMNDWIAEELGGREPALVDHSGLSGASRIAAVDMVQTLMHVGRTAPLAPLLKPFPVEDASVPLSVSAKTGTLNFVSALAGYLTAPSGRELAFAILTSDLDRRDALSEAERERPPGGKAWAGRSRTLQRRLLATWAVAHA